MTASTQDMFTLKCILTNIKVNLCTRIESGVKQLLAIVNSDGDVVLHYTYGELFPEIRRIPWLTETAKVIQAICFDPSATWLLVVTRDCSLYIIPALSLVDKKQKVDCKWSLTDLTHFPKHAQTPEAKPTSVVWWQTLDCNQNALVGYENGAVALISLTDGRCLGCCSVKEAVTRLYLCQDNVFDSVCLLINGISGLQWRLMLEQTSVGCLWPPESTNQSDECARSRLQNLKQMSVDKLATWKQVWGEPRVNSMQRENSRTSLLGSQSDTASESSHSESSHHSSPRPELLPCLSDSFFAPQYARNRNLFSTFYRPAGLLTVHSSDVETAPLFVHKLKPRTKSLHLTDRLIYTVNDDCDELSVISTQLSECRIEGESEFNPDALLAQFKIEHENIIEVFKLSDLSFVRTKKKKKDANKNDNKHYEIPKTVDEIDIPKPRIDTCVIVTNNSVYKLVISNSPINKFIHHATEENRLDLAERIALIFGLNTQQLLESCGDLMIARGSFHEGIILYKQAKVHLLKRVLKLAISADCRTLLKFVHLCLSASKLDMSMTTKIHIGNLAVMAYTELILRYGGSLRVNNTKDFMHFLTYEEFYDQVLAVNVACQAGHWNIVMVLAKSKGLQPEVVSAFGQILQSAQAPTVGTDQGFLLALSEPCLTQSLLVGKDSCCQEIFRYIRQNVDSFPVNILQRFAIQLDPSQHCIPSYVIKQLRVNPMFSSSSNKDDTGDAVGNIKDLIETFFYVLITLASKTSEKLYDLSLMDRIEGSSDQPNDKSKTKQKVKIIKNLPELKKLSCGHRHAALIRNHEVFTMGVSTAGCLGLGPLLTVSTPPKMVQTFHDLQMGVISVSCGRKHVVALTFFGVYAWGSNKHGQLGLGPLVEESPYPQMITGLAYENIIQVCAGRYHSLALTATGRVYSWGWGIHGQLGHGNCYNQYHPKLIDFEHKVAQVAAGHSHSLMLVGQGKLYGFGSNVFGQLEKCEIKGRKSTRPVWVQVMPDIDVPIVNIATAYFHNVALRQDQMIYAWGATAHEVRLSQSKNVPNKNGVSTAPTSSSWKDHVCIYKAVNKQPVDQIAVGYRHTAILQGGRLLWGTNKSTDVKAFKLKNREAISFLTHRFMHVDCGLDYTMAVDHLGKVFAWGCPSMAQTLLGRPSTTGNKSPDGKMVVSKNTKRIIKFPSNLQANQDGFPVEVPRLPTMEIRYKSVDARLLFPRDRVRYAVLSVENADEVEFNTTHPNETLDYVKSVPTYKWGMKTLHFALEHYHGLYDTEDVLSRCFDLNNLQAASKIAMLGEHYCDSLGFQLSAFKKYMDSIKLDLDSIFVNKEAYDVKEKEQDFVELVVKNMQDDFNEKNLSYADGKIQRNSNASSPARILSSSSSLDSIRQWGDEMEHQGGRESPCPVASDMGDVRHHMTNYVQSIRNPDVSPPISSVSRIISNAPAEPTKTNNEHFPELEIKDQTTKEIIEMASAIIEFYIQKIYSSENHILMQNVLMKSIEFWLTNSLPVPILENILLKNMDKYFYPLSILLFCKNFSGSDEHIVEKDKCDEQPSSSAGFLKQFSTKFCLQLCSMVLDNINKA